MRRIARVLTYATLAGLVGWIAAFLVLLLLFIPVTILGGEVMGVVTVCASLGWMVGVVAFLAALVLGAARGM